MHENSAPRKMPLSFKPPMLYSHHEMRMRLQEQVLPVKSLTRTGACDSSLSSSGWSKVVQCVQVTTQASFGLATSMA